MANPKTKGTNKVMAKATGQRIALTAVVPLALTESGPHLKLNSGGSLLMAQLSINLRSRPDG